MMKKIMPGLMAIVVAIGLAGCSKDAAAESTPEVITQEESTTEASTEANEPAKVSEIETEVSSPVEIEETEPKVTEESSDDFSDSDEADYRSFMNGDIFELDDYCLALGYEVRLPDPLVSNASYYTISSCGRDYSIINHGFSFQINYVEFDTDRIHTVGISKLDYHDPKNMVVRAINNDSDDVSERWVKEIAELFKVIATEEVDLSNLPVTVRYYHIVDEGRWQYQPDGAILWEIENTISNETINNT